MIEDIEKVSVSKEQIEQMITNLSEQINQDYYDKKPIFIGLLKGCNPFMMDLLKHIELYCTLDYMDVSSYDGTSSTGTVTILHDLKSDIRGKDVIVVDDILDTGRTLNEIKNILLNRGAKSVKICVLLDKPEGRKVAIEADYVGGLVPNEFVVGYGLDYNELYRNLPYIGVLKEKIYSK
ncbi:MAG: hypoxanthine phosphoribosyltransferase [Anaeroplasmataceae bacterium]|nr:hypoxanthine phosphoribosyltransferase [Anaeroplasmataceae bacterium]MDE5867906.1 hypoxanthine phosphoribosyltransferase [Anaeroplasmataceae bacterium]